MSPAVQTAGALCACLWTAQAFCPRPVVSDVSNKFTCGSVRMQGAPRRLGTMRMAVTPLTPVEVSPEQTATLIEQAQTVVDSDFGLKRPGLLADDFRYVWNYQGTLDKAEYLKTFQEFGLRKAFPDLFWNAYEFRADKYEKNYVWATIRPTGTHRGVLQYKKKEIEPTQKRLDGSPEAVAFVFNDQGKLTKLTGGFVMDRSVGNTGVAGSVWGFMNAVGEPVSPFKYYPPAKVLGDFFGRSFKPQEEKPLKEPPLPPPIMFALAEQIGNNVLTNPESIAGLLSEDFVFTGPIAGPLKKKEFLSTVGAFKLGPAFPDLTRYTYDVRLDEANPARVWFTSRGTGTMTGDISLGKAKIKASGKTFVSPPEAISAVFNKDGFICKYTVGAVMDPEIGNTGGLGGVLGILEGVGRPLPDWNTRPIPESVRRLVAQVKPKPAPKAKPAAKAKAAPGPAPASIPEVAKKAGVAVGQASKAVTSTGSSASPKATAGGLGSVRASLAKSATPAAESGSSGLAAPKPPGRKSVAEMRAEKAKAAAVAAAPTKPAPAAKASTKATPPLAAKPQAPKPSSPFGGLFGGGARATSTPKAPAPPGASKSVTPSAKAAVPPAIAKPAAQAKAVLQAAPATAQRAVKSAIPPRPSAFQSQTKPLTSTSTSTTPSSPLTKAKASTASTPVPSSQVTPKPSGGGLFGGLFGGGPPSAPAKPAAPAPAAVTSAKTASAKAAPPAPVKTLPAVKSAPLKTAPPRPFPPQATSRFAKAALAPPAPAVNAAPATDAKFTLPAEFASKLRGALGPDSGLAAILQRTEAYGRGAISITDYYGTLTRTVGKDNLKSVVPVIVQALPRGNQRKALSDLYAAQVEGVKKPAAPFKF